MYTYFSWCDVPEQLWQSDNPVVVIQLVKCQRCPVGIGLYIVHLLKYAKNSGPTLSSQWLVGAVAKHERESDSVWDS